MHAGCNIVERSKAMAALLEVCAGFFDVQAVRRCVEPMSADAVPADYRELLVHQDHMTTVLQRHCGEPVRLEVLDTRRDSNSYARKIALRPLTREDVVEVGVARIALDSVDEAVRTEILAGRKPLGEVLISHNVLRRVDARFFYRIASPSPILACFGRPATTQAFGRVGVIHCNGREGVQLLEVVSTGERD
ncbi:MAG: hypothetical protein IT449_17195 [Phycisphaerales bacterium]|nr:hypothetical protein [Phycisphaerales bacterium]